MMEEEIQGLHHLSIVLYRTERFADQSDFVPIKAYDLPGDRRQVGMKWTRAAFISMGAVAAGDQVHLAFV